MRATRTGGAKGGGAMKRNEAGDVLPLRRDVGGLGVRVCAEVGE